jgi:hypothetical protein
MAPKENLAPTLSSEVNLNSSTNIGFGGFKKYY